MKPLLLLLVFAAPASLRAATEVVRAAAFGFNPTNATVALQAAINSGARRVIVENMGAPWIVNKIQLSSDQEIVFEEGVVVQALRGAFKGTGDSLFTAVLKTNITLIGYGATLKMWKQDYDDPAQYKHAEWRHVLCFKSCANVRVLGLTLADSGGDGIYLGVAQRGVPCSDVLIKDVVCDNNYRQGISVISARNLLIENCVLKNTGGTAPMAGIDFEPNHPTEELVNCIMRNCVSENNRGSAYVFYLRQLRADSRPVSIRLENCRAVGCRNSVVLTTNADSKTNAVTGTMEFVDCVFEGGINGGIIVSDKPLGGARVCFVNCRLVNPATNKPSAAPIQLTSRYSATEDIGNIRFDNCIVSDPLNRVPLAYQDRSGALTVRDVGGTLVVNGTSHVLTAEVLARWIPQMAFKPIPKFDLSKVRFVPLFPDAKPAANRRCVARVRGRSEWLLWAEAAEDASFTVQIRRVGRGELEPVPVSVVAPSGKTIELENAQGEGETAYTFKPAETGAHKIICDPRRWTATVNSATHRVCLYSAEHTIHLLGTTGEYFFWVPPGTKEFALRVSGEDDAEQVMAALRDPTGKIVEQKDSIAGAHQFVGKPLGDPNGEIWSLRLDKPTTGVLEDFHVQFQGIPPVLAHTRESLLKVALP
ncbi:MAG: right-handed parallel beta-helix repeat-containing protein [Verrucomicrobiae bacterium]|nr:right-handed parallel beta-helix repeat-containing protein [Verrucomicrobiae bacterium]